MSELYRALKQLKFSTADIVTQHRALQIVTSHLLRWIDFSNREFGMPMERAKKNQMERGDGGAGAGAGLAPSPAPVPSPPSFLLCSLQHFSLAPHYLRD